jgi:hypothetical protein
LLWHAIAIFRKRTAEPNVVAVHASTPFSWERVHIISGEDAAVGGFVVPLKQDQVASKVVGQLETETVESTGESSVISHCNAAGSNVGTLGVVDILGGSVELIGNELERILFEAISGWNITLIDRTSMELKVSPMMSGEDNVDIDLVSLAELSLWISLHGFTKEAEILIIIGVADETTAGQGATEVCAMRAILLRIIVFGGARPDSVLPSDKIAGPTES